MILILAVVLAAALAMSALLRCPVPVAAPTAIFSVILVLFAFGSVHLLFVGWIVTCVLIAVGAAAGLVLRWREHGLRSLLPWMFAPVMLVYLTMLGVFGLSSRGLRFINWDEFSHWGRVVAAMVRGDALPPYATADLAFAAYPPGLPLWEYFLASFRSSFAEADVFLAFHALTLALFLPFASRLDWRRPRNLIFFMVSVPLLMTSFFTLDTVLIDPALAMTFGYCASLALLGSMDKGSVWRHLGPALAVLALLKDSGVLLALIAIALLMVRIGVRQRLELKSQLLSRVPAMVLHGGLGLLCVIVPTTVWRVIVKVTETGGNFETGTSLRDGLAPLFNQGEPWKNLATGAFARALTTEPITASPFPLSFWGWFAFALLLLVGCDVVRGWIVAGGRIGQNSRLPAAGTLLVGALVYIAGIWLTYMTAFSEWEGSRLASFPRYVKVYWLGVLFVCVAIALWALGSEVVRRHRPASGRVRLMAVFLLVALLSIGQVPELVKIVRRDHVINAGIVRGPYDATTALARRAGIGEGDRVWILDEHTTGFGFHVLSFELVDSHTSGWSVGPLKDPEDIWTRDLTADEWAEEMTYFDYLLVHHTEPAFAARYARFFEDPSALKDQSVFEVRESGRDSVVLVEVAP